MPESPGRVALDVAAYTAARLALVAVLTGVIWGAGRLVGVAEFPVVVALLFAFVLGFPLGIVAFGPLRRRATRGLAELDGRRRRDRAELHARLRGESDTTD